MTDNTPIYLTFGAGNVLRGPLLTLWARCFGGSYLQSGGVISEQSTPAMAVDVAALTGYLAGVAVSDSGDAVAIEASDETYDRIDQIYLDALGLQVAKGTLANIAPVGEADWKKWTAPAPAMLDTAEAIIPLAEIHVAAGATAIYEADIRMMACPVIYPAASAHNHLKGSWALDTVVLIGDWYQNDGGTYEALVDHTATADDEPGTGVNWETYWQIVAQGIAGTNGTDGAAAPTILFGTVAPTTEGSDGDIYFQNDGELVTLWGPKAEGAWPAEGTLLTKAGADGADGLDGADGTLLQTEYGITTPMLVLEQRTTPDEPAEGYVIIYGKADGMIYFLASGDSEKCLSPANFHNYCLNGSFENTYLIDALEYAQLWDVIGGDPMTPDADDPVFERVAGDRDGYGGVYALKITSGGVGHEGACQTLTQLKPATKYYVRIYMKPAVDSTAQAWTTGAGTNLSIQSIDTDGEFVAGEFVTDATPTDVIFCIGQNQDGDVATYDQITIAEWPAVAYYRHDHADEHYSGGSDPLTLSQMFDDGTDFLSSYLALMDRAAMQTVPGSVSPVVCIEYDSALTTGALSSLRLKHKTSANMADAFGANLSFAIEDSAAVNNVIAYIMALRDGADNTGKVWIRPFAAGSAVAALSVDSSGNLYVMANCSALSFTDRTKAFSGDALAAIEKIKANAKGELDHASLPEFAADTWQDEKGEWWPGRSIGDMLSVLVSWAQQYRAATDARIAALEKTIAEMTKKAK